MNSDVKAAMEMFNKSLIEELQAACYKTLVIEDTFCEIWEFIHKEEEDPNNNHL